jgi:hypothetical protein
MIYKNEAGYPKNNGNAIALYYKKGAIYFEKTL